ncbi:recombinase family protein [Leisingera aquaemixtae]|uniref:recombinase family protein n=1 Tax=Leisingera aquaemixtae TaxID=1396826 RepID=UPI0021A2D828|nr:recombinase family protein [Leisingera aquaemixtae]UWQ47689.1 recombinase family protein [Leisingera aquaemixtae]
MTATPALRAAIYARYSTDKQKDTSVEDQIRLCRRMCKQNGWQVTEVFTDHALSGKNTLRPGYQSLIQAAECGQIDIIVAESQNRLSRDMADSASLLKRMNFFGVKIHTASENELDDMKVGVGGLVSTMFLKDLAQKTRRGLEGRVAKGKSAGGISYGYRVKREILPDGTLSTGDREIEPEEAAVINRIFRDYADGLSARTIAAALNAEGVTAPQSGKGTGTWNPSTISGNIKRGSGILNNELYIGRLVWNRLTYDTNPDSGKRLSRLNPPEDWITEDVPGLRILDDQLWQAVKTRQGEVRQAMNPAGVLTERPKLERARRPTYLLSGLLRCACCGASYTLINKTRYGCAGARNKGAAVCTNRATIGRAEVEERVLSGLKQRLLAPDLLAQFAEEYRKAFNDAAAGACQDRKKAEHSLKKVESRIANILTAIEDGMYTASMKDKMAELEGEKARLEAVIADNPEPPALRLHPSLSARYRELIDDLAGSLNAPEVRREATASLRALISEVRMVPDADAPGGHQLELVGELAGLMALGSAESKKPPLFARAWSETVVAGAGFEPATFRL